MIARARQNRASAPSDLRALARMAIVAISVAFAVPVASSPAFAFAACPDWITPEQPARTHSNLPNNAPLSLPLTYVTPHGSFRIPYGYVNPWQVPKTQREDGTWYGTDFHGANHFFSFGFAFWMPELRYLERNLNVTPHLRPCEFGRPPPTDDQFVVRVIIDELDVRKDGTVLTPNVKIRNLTKAGGYATGERVTTSSGLIKITSSTPYKSAFYTSPLGEVPQVLFRCSIEEYEQVNPLCNGEGYVPGESFIYRVEIPRDAIGHWKAIWRSVNVMLDGWRIADPSAN